MPQQGFGKDRQTGSASLWPKMSPKISPKLLSIDAKQFNLQLLFDYFSASEGEKMASFSKKPFCLLCSLSLKQKQNRKCLQSVL